MPATESIGKNLTNVAQATAWTAKLRERDDDFARKDVLANLIHLERGSAPLSMDSINALVYSEEALADLFSMSLEHSLRSAAVSKSAQSSLCQIMGEIHGGFARLYHRFLVEKGDSGTMTDDLFVLLCCRGLLALGHRAKWASFQQEQLDADSWLLLHKLYRASEERGLQQRNITAHLKPKAIELHAAQGYAKVLLFATLTSGAFNARQLQTADEWLHAWCAGMHLDDEFERQRHFYYVDLMAPTGARRILGASSGALMRFLSTDGLSLQVERTKMAFRQGQVSASNGIDPVARAGEYAELLDKVDRIWSPEWMRSDQRSHRRVSANDEPIMIVRGLDALTKAATEDYEAEQPSATRALSQEEEFDIKVYGFVREQTRQKVAQNRGETRRGPREAWQLIDESINGYGMAARVNTDEELRLSQLIGIKRSKSPRWAVGYITRRLVQAAEGRLFVGVEVLSHNPVVVTLTEETENGERGKSTQGLFMPGDQGKGRADSLIVDSALPTAGKDYTLSARNVSYYVRLPRVIRRGQGWQRVAFEVVARRA